MITMRRAIGMGAAIFGGVALIAVRSAGAASAQQAVVFKESDVHPEGYPRVAAVEDMGAELDGGLTSVVEDKPAAEAASGQLTRGRASCGSCTPLLATVFAGGAPRSRSAEGGHRAFAVGPLPCPIEAFRVAICDGSNTSTLAVCCA
jgi:hypothetical protein